MKKRPHIPNRSSHHGLNAYLEAETKAIQDSSTRFKAEFKLFCELADLYKRASSLCKVHTPEALLGAKLFLVVQSQMYGVTSQMLRRRLTDAENLSRRAIEATAAAYRLWKHPVLIPVFEAAYPNANDVDDPKQWQPSDKYRKEFSTRKLFAESGEPWDYLKSLYSSISAMSSHAGPGATAPHELHDDAIELKFIESDNGTIRLGWNSLLVAYWEMLRVLFQTLRGMADENSSDVAVFEAEMVAWKQRAATVLQDGASSSQP